MAALEHTERAHPDVRVPFIVVFIIAILTSIPFVYRGFATADSMQYAQGLELLLRDGFGRVGTTFNGDMAVGYYMVLYCLTKILDGVMALSAMMNLLSAVTSIALQVVLFWLFHRLTGKPLVALFTCLATMISPSVWMHSHFGHPVLLGVALFAGALVVLDRIAVKEFAPRQERIWWGVFLVLATAAALMRLDIILAYGAFFGLLFYRRSFTLARIAKTFGVLVLAGVIVLAIHWIALGKIEAPGGQALSYHVANRLGAKMVLSNSLKNIALLAFATNVLMLLLAVVGFVRVGFRSRMWVLVLSWILPWGIFLPFQGMDFSRIAIPAIPPLMLLATLFVDGLVLGPRRKILALTAMIVVAQIAAAGLYYPLARWYPFKQQFEGRMIAAVPLGFPPADQVYRQRMITVRDSIAERVAAETTSNVLVISFTGRATYEYWLHHLRTVVAEQSETCDGVAYDRLLTNSNAFAVVDLELNAGVENAAGRIISCMAGNDPLIHIAPFSTTYVVHDDSLFHSAAEALRILRR